MRVRNVIAMFLLAALAAPVSAQESSREDFKEYCQMMQGRWVGDVTWVADWPGFGKKGDKVTAYAEHRIVEDGNVMTSRFFGGTGSGTGLCIYAARAKQIRLIWGDSAGTTGESIVFKKDGQWTEKGGGSLPDGTKTEFTSMLTITANGKTHTWTGSGTVGDEKADDQHDVWRRVSKERK